MGIFSKKALGIDIGVASIKIVEISSSLGGKKKLENYAQFTFPSSLNIETFQKGRKMFLIDQTAKVLKEVLARSDFDSKRIAFSIPDFSTFFTNFSLPPMNEEEVPKAVEFEARHHIPLPLSEVSFDWHVLEKKKTYPGLALKILLVAVPNKILKSYQKIADSAGVNLRAMEAEVFGLIRSSIGKRDSKKPVCLVDIGWESTTISIIEEETLQVSRSFDISGSSLTKALVDNLNLDWNEAERIKKEEGLNPDNKKVAEIIARELNSLSLEIDNLCSKYGGEGKKIEEIIITGGTSSMFGLKTYLESRTKKKVSIPDPFSALSCPIQLKGRLKKLGPSFAVAVGVGLMGLDN